MPYQLYFTQFNPAASSNSIITIKPNSMKMSLFSNNANVYYKPHNMGSGGVGTVRNNRSIARKT
jgi:hypothetical protein